MKKKRKGVNQERIEGASSQNWHENGNDYLPFLKYMLGIVVKAYNEFEDRVEYGTEDTENQGKTRVKTRVKIRVQNTEHV